MTLTLPPELAGLVAKAGGRWPQADEDQLHALAGSWRSLAGGLRGMKDSGSTIAGQVIAQNEGGSVDAFASFWAEFERQLDTATAAAESAADGVDGMAKAVLATKQAIAEAAGEIYGQILELGRRAGLSGGFWCIIGIGAVWLLRLLARFIWRALVWLATWIARGIAWLFKKIWAAIVAIYNWLKRLFKGKKQPPKKAPKDNIGATRVSNLHGKTLKEAEQELSRQGFKLKSETKGGYRHYKHEDGSEIVIRTNGEVQRLGPKINPGPNEKNYKPHYDQYGNRTQNHSTGETVRR